MPANAMIGYFSQVPARGRCIPGYYKRVSNSGDHLVEWVLEMVKS